MSNGPEMPENTGAAPIEPEDTHGKETISGQISTTSEGKPVENTDSAGTQDGTESTAENYMHSPKGDLTTQKYEQGKGRVFIG